MANLILWNTMHNPASFQKAGRPGGPHIIAQWLIRFGFTVKVIDFCSHMPIDDLVAITRKHIDSTTVAIGVSTTFWDDNARYHCKKDPTLLAISYQSHTVDPPEWVCLARTLLESSFPKLDWILGGANSDAPLTRTWLRFHQYPEDQLRKYLDEKLSLNKIHIPFDILTNTGTYMDDLGIRPGEVLCLEWGRGCQFRCRFCRYKSIGKKKNTYLRDPSIVRRDLILNYEKYGTTRYVYVDDTNNESIEKVESMARVAQSLPFEVEWVGYGRLDLIGTEKATISLLRDSGLRSMFFGIESFNKEASKIVGKGWNGVHGKEFLLELKQAWSGEIKFHINFITGLSPETSEELDDTHTWCIQNKITSWQFIPLSVTAIPLLYASEFDTRCVEFGYSFPDPNHPNYWVNGQWNRDLARTKAEILNNMAQEFTEPAAFLLSDLVNITGKSFKEVMSNCDKTGLALIASARSDEIIKDYVKYQLSI